MDKHRQAAVLTGERDVKTDVRIKKKRDRYLFFSRALYNHWDFRSTFIASRYKYTLNDECIKGKEDEKVYSGVRIRHNSFADFIILFRGFHPLQDLK